MITFETGTATDKGTVRPENEDYLDITTLSSEHSGTALLGIVCDGMGGYRGGRIASKLALETFKTHITAAMTTTPDDSQDKALMLEAAQMANQRVCQARQQDPTLQKMGTTLVAALVTGTSAIIIHVGDSRCYQLYPLDGTQFDPSDGTLKQLTRDDSVVQDMLDRGELSAEDIENSPFSHVLTRAIGPEMDVAFSVSEIAIQPGTQLLLCTDGITNALTDEAITTILENSASAQASCDALITESLNKAARDNITALVIRANEV